MARETLAALREKLDQAYKIIDAQTKQIESIHKQYSKTISRKQYDTLLKQYNNIDVRCKMLETLLDKEKEKKVKKIHNERGAGRKKKIDDHKIITLREAGHKIKVIAQKLKISEMSVKRAIKNNRPELI